MTGTDSNGQRVISARFNFTTLRFKFYTYSQSYSVVGTSLTSASYSYLSSTMIISQIKIGS